jgi:hypothetical protein
MAHRRTRAAAIFYLAFYGVPYPRERRPKADRNQVTEFDAVLNIDRREIVAAFDRIAAAERSP